MLKVLSTRDHAPTAILREQPENAQVMSTEQVRLAFDGDAVLFSEESELVYKTQGLDVFQRIEDEKQDVPLEEGPYATLLKKLATLQEKLQQLPKEFFHTNCFGYFQEFSFRDAVSSKTLRSWGVQVDEAFFLGGVDKTQILTAYNPHIFFDDQDLHLKRQLYGFLPEKFLITASRRLPTGCNTILKPVLKKTVSDV